MSMFTGTRLLHLRGLLRIVNRCLDTIETFHVEEMALPEVLMLLRLTLNGADDIVFPQQWAVSLKTLHDSLVSV